MKRQCWFFVLSFLFLGGVFCQQLNVNQPKGKNTRTIIINSANKIEYRKIDDNDLNSKTNEVKDEHFKGESTQNTNPTLDKSSEVNTKATDNTLGTESKKETKKIELIILTGNVKISITDGANTDTIFANKIIYNKTRNTIHGEDNVSYERKNAGKVTQSFKGNSILFDIDKMSGVFLDGIIENASQSKNQPNYTIHSEITGLDESGVIAFKNAKLTTSSSDEPLWSINASRIWLLPGNEMSFANGYYSIGIVPVFYLPFFYYPKDEMLFHPVFGYFSREGYFVQTTTYLIGRKKLASKDSKTTFSNFMVSDTLKEQKRDGLFFQNLQEDAKIQDPSYLKVIADAYSALGFLLGIEGNFASRVKYFNTLEFNAFFGFSHTLYPIDSNGKIFSMYNYKGESKFDKSNVFGTILPFRYSGNFSAGVDKYPIRLAIDFPLISDPYFQQDFFNRSEDMNWFKFMLNTQDGTKKTTQSQYNWKLKFSVNPSIKVLLPFLSSFSSNISSQVLFNARHNEILTGEKSFYSPDRDFYYPYILKNEIDLNFNGTIFSTSMLDKKNEPRPIQIPELQNPFIKENHNMDYTTSDNSTKEDVLENNKKATSQKNESVMFIENFLPLYKHSDQNKADFKLVNYDLNFAFDTRFLHEGLWDEKWKQPSDINWKSFKSQYYKINYKLSLNSSLNLFSNILKMENRFNFIQNHQRHPYVKDITKKDSLNLNNLKASTMSMENYNAVTISPFYFSEVFSATNIQWSISELLFQTKFDNTVNSKYRTEKIRWNKDFIKSHNFSSTFSLKLDKYTQSLKLVAALPPLLSSYGMTALFQHPYGSLSVGTRISEKEKLAKKWLWSPISFDANWNLPYEIKTNQSYSYNIEDKKSDKFQFGFSWKYFSFNFLMQDDFQYKLNPTSGWQVYGSEKKFIPKSFEFRFSNTSDSLTFYFWKNRIRLSFALQSTLNINMQKITESFFTFEPTISLSIYEFLTLKISTVSRNNAIARYFQDAFNLGVIIPGEKNILLDLAKSFYFWDVEARKKSGFKIKSVNIALEHDLKDWTLSFSYSFAPELQLNKATNRREYKFIPKITFLVSWKPITDFRVKTTKNDKEFNVERGSIR